jgi:hypothetical protein
LEKTHAINGGVQANFLTKIFAKNSENKGDIPPEHSKSRLNIDYKQVEQDIKQ